MYHPVRLASLAVLLLGIVLMKTVSPAVAQTPTPGRPSTCTDSLPAVQAPPSGVIQTGNGFGIVPTQLDSLDEAQSGYSFPMLLPTAIPDDFQLSRILYEHATTPQFETLTVCYLTSDGHYLQVQQGSPLPTTRGVYDATPDDQKGTATVQGEEAYWTLGVLTAPAPLTPAQLPKFVWQPGPLKLTWSTNILVPSPEGAFIKLPGGQLQSVQIYVGYQLESDSLGLDDLLAIANSVQPYATSP